MSESISITTATVPSNFCFTTWQESWSYLTSLLSGTMTGNFSTFNFGITTPSADNQDKPWFRLDSTGRPDRWYVWFAGQWISPVIPYSIYERRIFVGAESEVWLYDGGSGDNPSVVIPTIYTGAMWNVDTAMSARFLAGVGTTAGGTAITLAGTGGVDVLTETQIPEHSHSVVHFDTAPASATYITSGSTDAISHLKSWSDSADYNLAKCTVGKVADTGRTSTYGTASTGTSMPPYYGVYFIQRTARMFYTV